MLLVLSIIGLLSAVTIPFYQSMQIDTQRETVGNELIANLHRAKLKAIASVDDQSWGINIKEDNQIIMFKGSDFLGRDTVFDETIVVPSNITVGKGPSDITQIIFNKFTGLPSASGIITISDVTGQSKEITITQQGTVDY
jgi:Tfp pilus assembly protein FimT